MFSVRSRRFWAGDVFGIFNVIIFITMYLSVIRIYPAPEHEHAIIDILDSLRGPITAIADCLACLISVEIDGDRAICYLEKWQTYDALQQHLRSALYDRVLAAMELSRQPPDVMFYDVTEAGSMGLVEQARLLH